VDMPRYSFRAVKAREEDLVTTQEPDVVRLIVAP
jgi:hypothetical protein